MKSPQTGWVPCKEGRLFALAVGDGQPIIVLHGGPDFDHTCLLPAQEFSKSRAGRMAAPGLSA
jgi:hypothetical protein